MACVSGPSIPANNLVMVLDALNPKTITSNSSNIIYNRIWATGNSSFSSTPYYSYNGTAAENQRIYDTTPSGLIDVVWESPSNDATSDGDGGWDGWAVDVDKTKKYRWSVWIRKKVIGDGRAYLGLYAYDANNTNVGVYNRTDGTTLNTNFYFMSRRFDISDLVPNPAVNEWVLFVGNCWPAGSAANTTPDSSSGVWKADGTKIADAGDCIWHPNTTKTLHRTYQYYSTTTNEKQQWWQPRIDIVDGSEPSLSKLLSGFTENSNYDIKNRVKVIANNALKTSNSFAFSTNIGNSLNNISESIYVDGSNLVFSSEQTIIMGLKPRDLSQRRNVYNQSYYGYGTITQETNGQYNYYFGAGANTTSYTGYGTPFYAANNETMVIAVTRNSNNITWFKNGQFQARTSNPYPVSAMYSTDTNIISIGFGYTGYGFIGDIYFTHLYDRALANSEISQNFEAFRGRYGI